MNVPGFIASVAAPLARARNWFRARWFRAKHTARFGNGGRVAEANARAAAAATGDARMGVSRRMKPRQAMNLWFRRTCVLFLARCFEQKTKIPPPRTRIFPPRTRIFPPLT